MRSLDPVSFAPILAAIAGCRPAPSPEVGDSGSPELRDDACAREDTLLGTGSLGDLWRAPDGRVFAVSSDRVARRDPSGTWFDEVGPPTLGRAWQIDGAEAAPEPAPEPAVWAVANVRVATSDKVFRRAEGGAWEAVPGPAVDHDLVDVHVTSTSEGQVQVVGFEDLSLPDSEAEGRRWRHVWDGEQWRSTVGRTAPGWLRAVAPVPGGGLAEVWSTGAVYLPGEDLPVPGSAPELDGGAALPEDFASGPDGTLVVAAGEALVWGSAEDLRPVRPQDELGLTIRAWTTVWVGGADDVWAVADHRLVVHWDGTAWAEVPTEVDGRLEALLGDGPGVLAVGGARRRLVLYGDRDGLDVELDEPGLDSMRLLARDGVTGEVWATGVSTLAHTPPEGPWEAQPLADGTSQPLALTASGGRVALYDSALWVLEEGAFTRTALAEDVSVDVLAGGGGALVALGRGDGALVAWQSTRGSLWEDLPQPGAALPPEATATAAWVDGPGEVWVGFQAGVEAGLAELAGGSGWSRIDVDLPSAPHWIARQPHGELWLAFAGDPDGDSQVWALTDGGLQRVTAVPSGMFAAHRLADGTYVAQGSGFLVEPTGLWRSLPDETWAQLSVEGSWQLVGSDTRVWTVGDNAAVTLTCDGPRVPPPLR